MQRDAGRGALGGLTEINPAQRAQVRVVFFQFGQHTHGERHGRADPLGPPVQVLARPEADRHQPSAHHRIHLHLGRGGWLAPGRVTGRQPHHHVPAERRRRGLGQDLGGELPSRVAIHGGDQQPGALSGQRLEGDPGGALPDHETGQRVTTGDQRVTTRAAGQHRAGVRAVDDVVQDHQHPPISQL